MRSFQGDIAAVLVDPSDHDGHEKLQTQDQNEDQDEADDGVLQRAFGFLPVLRFLGLGKLDAQNHTVQSARGADDQEHGGQDAVEQGYDRGYDRIKRFLSSP